MTLTDVLNQTQAGVGQRGSLEEEAQSAYRWAQQQYAQQASNDPGGHLENTDSGPQWTADSPLPKDPNSQEYKDAVNGIAIKALADRHGWNYVSDNLGRVAPLLPGLNISNTYQQLSNLKDSDKRVADARDETFDQFMSRAVPLTVAAGGVYTGLSGAGLTGAAGGASDAIPASAAGVGVEGGAGAAGAAPAVSDATLQSILNSANVPSAANGVQVAGPTESAAGQFGTQVGTTAMPAEISATPQTFTATNGVLSAGSGLPGVNEALITGAGGTAAAQAVNPASDPNTNVNAGPADPTQGQTTDPNSPGIQNDGVTPVTTPTTGSSGSGSSGALSRIMDGTASTADWLSVIGGGAATGLGIYGANEQANKLKEIADRYYATGAPSRDRYEASFAPGFRAADMPGYQDALDTSTESLLRKASTGGNPVGNPGVMAEIAKYVTGNVALPALQNYRSQNANTGGYSSFNTAAPSAATGAVGAGSNVYNAIGSGIADLTNPRMTLADLARSLNTRGLT